MSWKNFVLPLLLLSLWGLQDGVQACKCFPTHPQQLYCQAGVVVIKAKVVGVMPGYQDKPTKYDIKHIKTFKGVKRLFDAVYTRSSSAACGVTLTKGVEYLLMAKLQSDGSLHISACDFYQPCEDLSTTQKNLLYRYGEGCACTIKSCFIYPCCMSGPTECVWTDLLSGKMNNHDQARNYACVKMRDGCCKWDKGAAMPMEGYQW